VKIKVLENGENVQQRPFWSQIGTHCRNLGKAHKRTVQFCVFNYFCSHITPAKAVEEGAKRLFPSSEICSQPQTSLLATSKVAYNNIKSAPNPHQTQPKRNPQTKTNPKTQTEQH